MSMKKFEFEAFGVKYRTTQFSAVVGLSLIDNIGNIHPAILLSKTEILIGDDWLALSPMNINRYVKDRAGAITPILALRGVMKMINDANFGFVDGWKRVTVPARFISDSKTVKAEGVEPIVATLIQENIATLRELEEYYSLEDAFNLFDVLMSKTVNGLLGQEEAEREAKTKRR